jgi:hypothetical protein
VAEAVDKQVIWFVQSGSSKGSAVAVRLCPAGGHTKTYLLTCGHALRGKASDGVEGAGFALDPFQGWQSGVGFATGAAHTLRVVAHGVQAGFNVDLPRSERGPSLDWVVLEIATGAMSDAPAVTCWSVEVPTGPFFVLGFPGETFRDYKVEPTRTYDNLMKHGAGNGVIEITGDATRPGMSGGGVFDAAGVFIGIHRSSRDPEIKLIAVSAAHIRKRLKEQGFDVITDPAVATPASELAAIVMGAFEEEQWRAALHAWWPPPSTQSRSPNLLPEEALAPALRALAAFGPGERGIPLFGFAYDLNRLKPAPALKEWIGRYYPNEVPPPPAPESKRIPRIMVDVKSSGEGGFHFDIRFAGFSGAIKARELENKTPEDFPAVLKLARDDIPDKTERRKAWIELIIPKELLAWSAESIDLQDDKFNVRIGTTQPFSLRLRRGKDQTIRLPDRSRTFHWCESFDAIPEQCAAHLLVGAAGETDPDQFFQDLVATDALGVVWGSLPRIAANGETDVWDALSEAGIPLVLWLRQPAPAPAPPFGAGFHGKKWDDLAREVGKLRADGSRARKKGDWHPGQHLALIFEDAPLQVISPHAP